MEQIIQPPTFIYHSLQSHYHEHKVVETKPKVFGFLTRYAGVDRLLHLIGHLYSIGVWIGEDQRNKHHKDDTYDEEIGPRSQFSITAPNSVYGITYYLELRVLIIIC